MVIELIGVQFGLKSYASFQNRTSGQFGLKALAIALLANQGLAHQCTLPNTTGPSLPPVTRGPKLERPKVNIGVSTEEWNVFTRRWEVFRTGSGIDDESTPSQLFQCAGNELGDSLLKANPRAASNTLQDLLAAMRSLAVIPVATGVLRTELVRSPVRWPLDHFYHSVWSLAVHKSASRIPLVRRWLQPPL